MAGHRTPTLAAIAGLLLAAIVPARAEDAPRFNGMGPEAAASQIADIFSKVGDQIYEDCIFELTPEQVQVQHALIRAYIENGADSALARQLAVKQIQPPELSPRCAALRDSQQAAIPVNPSWDTALEIEKGPQLVQPPTLAQPPAPAEPQVAAVPSPVRKPEPPAVEDVPTVVALKDRKVLPQWDCAPHVDYVTITIGGHKRKLSGGEICKPYKDVVHKVPDSVAEFGLGYVISTGRLFIVSDDPSVNGRTIAWAISGREICRNNPDPDCLGAKGIGSLPPGRYAFNSDPDKRINFGPRTKRYVAGIYLKELWNRERFTAAQTKKILKRGNIAIHARYKGEMSEACIGLEPKGWAYVASLIKQGRATGLNAYLEEPHPQVAEAPPLIEGSSFSLTSLFKL